MNISEVNLTTLKSCESLYTLYGLFNGSMSLCNLVQAIDACQFNPGIIQYNYFLYCDPGWGSAWPIVIMIVWLLFLLILLATSADAFFAPCLVSVAKLARMSDNLAGVTLLAFGNGAPDLFSSLSAVEDMEGGNAGMAFGAILGAALLVNCVTAGIITLIQPFHCPRRPIMKDLGFLLITLLWFLTIFIRKRLYLGEAVGLMALYVVYVGVTLASRWVSTTFLNRKSQPLEEASPNILVTTDDVEQNDLAVAPVTSERSPVTPVPMCTTPTIVRSHSKSGSVSRHSSDRQSPPARIHRVTVSGASPAPHITSSIRSSTRRRHKSVSAQPDDSPLHRHDSHRQSLSGFSKNNVHLARWLMNLLPEDEWRDHSPSRTPDTEESERRTSLSQKDEASPDFPKVDNAIKLPEISISPPIIVLNCDECGDAPPSECGAESTSDDKESSVKPSHQQLQVPTVHFGSDRWSHGSFSGRSTAFSVHESIQEEDLERETGADSVAVHLEDRPPSSLVENEVPPDGANVEAPKFEETMPEYYEPSVEEEQPGDFMALLKALNPLDVDEWHNMNLLSKSLEVLRSPFMVLLRLTTPVVDYEQPLRGWCRLLNTLHCIITPIFWLMPTKWFLVPLTSGYPLICLFVVITPILALLVWCTSKSNREPKYHFIFALVGCATSIMWIYSIANEIVNILNSLGVRFGISDAILGVTFLAWANCIGDMMSNIVLARNNYPRIGICACVGSPIFTCLIGLGLPFTIRIVSQGTAFVEVVPSLTTLLLLCTLISVILLELIVYPLTRFKLPRGFSVLLIIIYVAFLLVAVLYEAHVIPYVQF